MATLQRLTGKVFAGKALLTDLGVFGSALNGTPTNPTAVNTDAQIQSDSAYENGWTDAVVTTKNFPPIEEVNGVLRTISHQACYLLQAGIPTWDANTAYDLTSIVKVVNGSELILYHPIQLDANNECKGHAVNETAWWEKVIITGDREIGVPQITLDFSGSLPANCVDLRGQYYDITSDPSNPDYKYQRLYSIYGTDYNLPGDGAGIFRVPDFTNRAIYGGTSAGYIAAGLPSITATAVSNGNHDHGKGNMNIRGYLADLAHQSAGASISATGCFSVDKSGGTSQYGYAEKISTGYDQIEFDAASNWSGRTEYTGNHSHTINVSVGGGITTNADSVYTKGVKVRVFTRYQ